jgi:CRISPR system Cascade subunit CasB
MQQHSSSEGFVAFLQGLAQSNDRSALAALRRGLGRPPGEEPSMHRYVAPWYRPEQSRWAEDTYYLVAALFAHHPVSWDERSGPSNLGASFARLQNAGGGSPEAVERRFASLLGVDAEDLHLHLRHAVSLLKSQDIPVDWGQLLTDLRWWGHEDRWVQRRWAQAFWGRSPQPGETEDTET